jgi:ubiquinone/menaquinone biosynthesis C-methylase UbiE
MDESAKSSTKMNQPAQEISKAYDIIATQYEGLVGGPFNTEYERPATLDLLGDVSGKRLLDAGCGPGSFAALLVEKGATVSAFDTSPEMVHSAKQVLGESATVMQADLNKPLNFLESQSFDVILSSLVLDYVKDWDSLFTEFFRILCDNGQLVISIHHPFFLDLKNNQEQIEIDKNYFHIQPVEENWSPTGMGIPSYRRPLGAISNAFWNSGFLIERIVEPIPTEAWRAIHEPFYEKWMEHPVIICISARKR